MLLPLVSPRARSTQKISFKCRRSRLNLSPNTTRNQSTRPMNLTELHLRMFPETNTTLSRLGLLASRSTTALAVLVRSTFSGRTNMEVRTCPRLLLLPRLLLPLLMTLAQLQERRALLVIQITGCRWMSRLQLIASPLSTMRVSVRPVSVDLLLQQPSKLILIRPSELQSEEEMSII